MRNIEDKFDGAPGDTGKFFAKECNAINWELQNIITHTGQTLNSANKKQILEAINRLSKGFFYRDVSAVQNAYSLTRDGLERVDTQLTERATLFFEPILTNTGDCTVTVSGLGAYPITNEDNSRLIGGEIQAGEIYLLHYDHAHQTMHHHQITQKNPKVNNMYLAGAVFHKDFDVGSQVGDNAMGLVDEDDEGTFGIKSITLDLVHNYPTNLFHDFITFESLQLRVYKIELSISPVDDSKFNIGFVCGDSHIIYRWLFSHIEYVDTGYAAPYNKRAIVYLIHNGMHAGLLNAMHITPAPNPEINFFGVLSKKYPHMDSFTGHFVGGGWLFYGSNFFKIPKSIGK